MAGTKRWGGGFVPGGPGAVACSCMAGPAAGEEARRELRRVVLRLPVLPMPSLGSNGRLGWRELHDQKTMQAQAWASFLHNAGAREMAPFAAPVGVRITVRGTGSKTDPQNWTTNLGIKVLLDVLTAQKGNKLYGLGLIPGDGCRDIATYETRWGGVEGEPETVVEIWEEPLHG